MFDAPLLFFILMLIVNDFHTHILTKGNEQIQVDIIAPNFIPPPKKAWIYTCNSVLYS